MEFSKNDTLNDTKNDTLNDTKNNSEINELKEKITKLEAELAKYKNENNILNNKVDHLKDRLDAIIDDKAIEILDHFRCTDSIRRTAWNYGMEMEELYHLIIEWDDCDDGLRGADDYIECTIEIYGRKQYDEEHEDEFTEEQLKAEREQKMRTPEQDTINKMIEDYRDASELSLYELADRYDLWINNLFRLLKENNLIEKETDAKGYDSFYTEHVGTDFVSKTDKKIELGLIEEYYRKVINKSTSDNVPDNISDNISGNILDNLLYTCDTCETMSNTMIGNKCFTCKKWNCNKCIIYKTETNIYYCKECFKNTNTEIRDLCNLCDTYMNIEDGTECNTCRKWFCEGCIFIEQEQGSYYYYCEECYKNKDPTIRAKCIKCETFYNIEEGTLCCTCERYNCFDCIIGENNSYYCDECYKNKNSEHRETCVLCDLTDNIEDGADCHKCKKWVCTECVIFNDDGNYYCNMCNII